MSQAPRQPGQLFSKLLIANRGEIACRIIRSCKRLGIQSVAVYSVADVNAQHVAMSDEAVCIGAEAPKESYLCIDKILDACRSTGAQAVHPGYGFLSENTEFAAACEAAGIAFVGPTVENMKQFALKHVARALAVEAQVPTVPGSPILQDITEAEHYAQRIGYPLVIKSTGGGGGIGMQRCDEPSLLQSAFESATRTSSANFRDKGVYIEKFVTEPRHIEVQIFGDGEGNVISLGERECSIQRRFQKIVEESPSPFVLTQGSDYRKRMLECAVALGKKAAYRSAGTVEFVVDDISGAFYFLEVNTRLQVEHGVTELVTGQDLVEMMIRIAAGQKLDLEAIERSPVNGHAIETRVYAEDPGNSFRPTSGLLTKVSFPSSLPFTRFDGWVGDGTLVSPFYDPLLVKVMVHGSSRAQAIEHLKTCLDQVEVHGFPNNLYYLQQIAQEPAYGRGETTTNFVSRHPYKPSTMDVKASGFATTIQDFPGRTGYWDIGVSPSGPMDHVSFRMANKLVGNEEGTAGLEITMTGPTLKINCDAIVALTGAQMDFSVNGVAAPMWQSVVLSAGDIVSITKGNGPGGCRAFLAIHGGINVPDYLGSKSTFVLGKMGGLHGGNIKVGDVIPLRKLSSEVVADFQATPRKVPEALRPAFTDTWDIGVLYGPHGAPDFFSETSIGEFFNTTWVVHANNSRLGVRLEGDYAPVWARSDGGEAGLHPSNIHDCVYAIGSINFTGDYPVIITADGPSLGGFVCPATVVHSEMWKVGQVKAGDTVCFRQVTYETSIDCWKKQDRLISQICNKVPPFSNFSETSVLTAPSGVSAFQLRLFEISDTKNVLNNVIYRMAGDHDILLEYGPMVLDINLRCKVERIIQALRVTPLDGLQELSPGVRSLQLKYDPHHLPLQTLIDAVKRAEQQNTGNLRAPCRVVHLPISVECRWTQAALKKYAATCGADKPYLPSNIDFIARINGLESREDVAKLVSQANYMVLGLGDVYLGAPCATPLDPRHRLVTSKFSPARSYTPEGVVGIGGAYMCIYGMDSPGGYQLVGRTLPIWNAFTTHRGAFESGKPWLLRSFDQVKFYLVNDDELQQLRTDFRRGSLQIRIEQTTFDQGEYQQFLQSIESDCAAFKETQQAAFNAERRSWEEKGFIGASSAQPSRGGSRGGSRVASRRPWIAPPSETEESPGTSSPEERSSVQALVTGKVICVHVAEGDTVAADQPVVTLEAMKMELPILAPKAGKILQVLVCEQDQVQQGDALVFIC